jgi:riboflavin biosynthesis pyrimidine reductase
MWGTPLLSPCLQPFPDSVCGMRLLLPDPVDPVDAYDAYRPDDPRGALLRVNMIASADGAATDEHGLTEGLTAEGDRWLFRVLRAMADGILVGAGTARAERYGPHRLHPELAERRRADGRSKPAQIVVVSRTLDLDYASPLFTEAQVPTVLLTCEASPTEARARAAHAGRVLVAGDEAVDLAEGIRLLRSELGLAHLLCEGGPSLNVPLFERGLVDELCLTVAPLLIGSHGPRILHQLGERVNLELREVYEQDGELYLRYGVQ